MDTKTSYTVGKRQEGGKIALLTWTESSDKNALEGIKALVKDFNGDEEALSRTTARGETASFVVIKTVTTFEEIR